MSSVTGGKHVGTKASKRLIGDSEEGTIPDSAELKKTVLAWARKDLAGFKIQDFTRPGGYEAIKEAYMRSQAGITNPGSLLPDVPSGPTIRMLVAVRNGKPLEGISYESKKGRSSLAQELEDQLLTKLIEKDHPTDSVGFETLTRREVELLRTFGNPDWVQAMDDWSSQDYIKAPPAKNKNK